MANGMISIDDRRCWPNDPSYTSTCPHCKNTYFGPKRAPSCWLCAGEVMKDRWLKDTNGKPKKDWFL